MLWTRRVRGALSLLSLLGSLSPLRAQIQNIVVTSAASFQTGVPAPGSIGVIFCTGLTISGTASAPANQALPFSLAGIAVNIGGAPAPLFAVADLGGYQQINFQVPLGAVPTAADETVTVVQNGTQGSAIVSPSTTPGDFFRLGNTQFGIFQHASDYSLVTPDNPAAPGESLIGYATGLPTPSPTVPAGQVAPLSPLYQVLRTITRSNGPALTSTTLLYVAGNAEPLGSAFMGLAPGEIGVYQVNFTLDPQMPSGNVSVRIVSQYCSGSTVALTPYPCNVGVPGPGIDFTYGQTALIPVR